MKHVLILAMLLLLPFSMEAQKRGKTTKKSTKVVAIVAPPVPEIDPREELLLAGMERVVLFDSIVVPKVEMLKAYQLSPMSGRLEWQDAACSQTKYVGGYGDVAYSAMPADTILQTILCTTQRYGNEWTEPEPVCSAENRHPRQSFPYLCADGMTLYFAQEAPDGMGGLDLYMTRRGGEQNTFFTPENMGYPYNSEGNDYLLVIDEEYGFGCFASDRRQPADSVCVYYFMPNEMRDTYENDSLSIEKLQSLARIDSISATWRINPDGARAMRSRLAEIVAQRNAPAKIGSTSTQRQEAQRALEEMEDSLLRLRERWHQGERTSKLQELILELEERLAQQRRAYRMAQ